jgi:hypothetical protein
MSSHNADQVTMVEGSPYNKLIAINDQPLPAVQAAAESEKYQQEVDRRRKEQRPRDRSAYRNTGQSADRATP